MPGDLWSFCPPNCCECLLQQFSIKYLCIKYVILVCTKEIAFLLPVFYIKCLRDLWPCCLCLQWESTTMILNEYLVQLLNNTKNNTLHPIFCLGLMTFLLLLLSQQWIILCTKLLMRNTFPPFFCLGLMTFLLLLLSQWIILCTKLLMRNTFPPFFCLGLMTFLLLLLSQQ